jgi:hypothetical protein
MQPRKIMQRCFSLFWPDLLAAALSITKCAPQLKSSNDLTFRMSASSSNRTRFRGGPSLRQWAEAALGKEGALPREGIPRRSRGPFS